MKLIEGERLHMSSVGNTYKLSIADVRTQDYGVYYCRCGGGMLWYCMLCYGLVLYGCHYYGLSEASRRASNLLEREVNGAVQLTGGNGAEIINSETVS